MKTGWPDYYIPLGRTVSQDVKKVFVNVRKRMVKLLQVSMSASVDVWSRLKAYLKEHDGELSFATDMWMSPNHKAFIAVTTHFEKNGEPMCILLDLVEVAQSHSGLNLAAAFVSVLEDFGISDKVSIQLNLSNKLSYLLVASVCVSPVTTPLPMTQ